MTFICYPTKLTKALRNSGEEVFSLMKKYKNEHDWQIALARCQPVLRWLCLLAILETFCAAV